LSPELSRDFRGLRVWLPIKMAGLGAFRAALDEKLSLASWVFEELSRHPHLDIVAPPQLSTVVFKLRTSSDDVQENNRRNQMLLDAINEPGAVYLTGTTLEQHFVLRVCILSFRTHRVHAQNAIDAIFEGIVKVMSDSEIS